MIIVARTHNWRQNQVKITKIFRGSPQLIEGTIELITYAPAREPIMMGDKIVGYEDSPTYLNFSVSSKGVFFCVPIDTNKSPTNTITDNTIVVRPYSLNYEDFIGFPNYHGLLRNFGTKEKVYEYLRRFENITIPEE